VVTHRDNPNENIWWRSVAKLAESRSIPVFMPENVNAPEFVQQMRDWKPDIIISFYFRQMVSPAILDLPPRGCLNLHGSLLPKYAGRAPVNWVLVNGETETGVTLHYMVTKPDAGDIVAQQRVPIDFRDTAKTLFDKVTVAAAAMFREIYPQIEAGTAPRLPQDFSQRTYFGGRKPADGLIEWSLPAVRIYNLVRAVTHPYPGAFTTLNGRQLFVWEAWPTNDQLDLLPGTVAEAAGSGGPRIATGEGALVIHRAQMAGEHELPGTSLFRQNILKPGDRLGD
jgi:methionyl-tRNA formyltransferase